MQSATVAIHYHSPASRLAAGSCKQAIASHGGDCDIFQADLTKVKPIFVMISNAVRCRVPDCLPGHVFSGHGPHTC